MTDEQIEQALDEMQKLFGELPNPEHEPKRFQYFVNMYLFYKERELTYNTN